MECLLWRMLILSRSVSKHGHHMQFLFLIGRFLKESSPLKLLSQMNRNLVIRNKTCLWRPYLLMDRDEMSNLYRGPSIDASYQVSVHLTKRFQRRRLKCEKLTDDRRRIPIRVITKLPNSEQSYKGKVKTHKYINRQNQSTTTLPKTMWAFAITCSSIVINTVIVTAGDFEP
jgi:hypothetical protein